MSARWPQSGRFNFRRAPLRLQPHELANRREVTAKEERLLIFLRFFNDQHGRMPTMKELEHRLKVTRGTLYGRLVSLVRKGKLKWLPRGTLNVQLQEDDYIPGAADDANGTS